MLCPAILFCLAMIFRTSKIEFTFAQNFQVPNTFSTISQSQQSGIDLEWIVSVTVERDYCMLRTLLPCFAMQTALLTHDQQMCMHRGSNSVDDVGSTISEMKYKMKQHTFVK